MNGSPTNSGREQHAARMRITKPTLCIDVCVQYLISEPFGKLALNTQYMRHWFSAIVSKILVNGIFVGGTPSSFYVKPK